MCKWFFSSRDWLVFVVGSVCFCFMNTGSSQGSETLKMMGQNFLSKLEMVSGKKIDMYTWTVIKYLKGYHMKKKILDSQDQEQDWQVDVKEGTVQLWNFWKAALGDATLLTMELCMLGGNLEQLSQKGFKNSVGN